MTIPLTAWEGRYTGIQYDVTAIGENAFAGNADIISVDMDWVTTIGSHAFSGCTKLKEVECEKVTSVEEYAFSECPKLTTVYFHD